MNRLFLIAYLFATSSFSVAQTVSVRKLDDKIKGESMEGFATDVRGKREDASTTLTKIMKEHGKIKFLSSDPLIVTNPVLNGNLYEKGVLYASLKEANTLVTIWIGRKGNDWLASQKETVDKEIEKLVYQTGIQFYRDQVQSEIDQAQQALDAVAKQITRSNNQGKDLIKKLESNDLEKIKLQQALEANKLEDAILKVKIENNKKAQDSLAVALSQIKEIKKVHEEKLRKIN